jgi:hypothetical protein
MCWRGLEMCTFALAIHVAYMRVLCLRFLVATHTCSWSRNTDQSYITINSVPCIRSWLIGIYIAKTLCFRPFEKGICQRFFRKSGVSTLGCWRKNKLIVWGTCTAWGHHSVSPHAQANSSIQYYNIKSCGQCSCLHNRWPHRSRGRQARSWPQWHVKHYQGDLIKYCSVRTRLKVSLDGWWTVQTIVRRRLVAISFVCCMIRYRTLRQSPVLRGKGTTYDMLSASVERRVRVSHVRLDDNILYLIIIYASSISAEVWPTPNSSVLCTLLIK